MSAVVFETPGLIDVRAFTIMGAHAKPNSANPIGYFGTGLKYAIAVLVRLGAEPVVWVGRDRLSFSTYASTFRGLPLETIKMRVLKDGQKRPRYFELPFTTRYGAKWEPWMAFRELESNTRDEGGKTWVVEKDVDVNGLILANLLENNRTAIVVENCPAFYEAARKIDSIFLPRAKRSGTLLEAIDANDRPNEEDAQFVFYRTMRAKDVGKPTLYTYNILETMTLTEDRQLAYDFQIKNVLARWVLFEATEEQVEAIVTADEEWFEHGLEFPGHVAPNPAFAAVMRRRPKGLSRYAHSYWDGRSGGDRPKRERVGFSLYAAHPKPWKANNDAVLDADGEEVFVRPDAVDGDHWDAVAYAIIRRLDVLPIPGAPAIVDAAPQRPPELEVILVPRNAPCPAEVAVEQGDEIPF